MKVNRKQPKWEDGTETRASRGFQCRLVNQGFAQSQFDLRTCGQAFSPWRRALLIRPSRRSLAVCDFDGGSKTSGSLRSGLEVYVIRSGS